MKIISTNAIEILDSRGLFTVRAFLTTEQGIFKGDSPSGTSSGRYEAKEVLSSQAVQNIQTIINPKIAGMDFSGQNEFDQFLIELDGTTDKSRLGANAILSLSIAFSRSLSQFYGGLSPVKLPRPAFNLINGGKHGTTTLQAQEFLVCPNFNSFQENLRAGVLIYQTLKKILEEKFSSLATAVGYEGGFCPPLKKTEDALNLIWLAVKKSGFEKQIELALDLAASEFYENGKYNFEGKKIKPDDLLKFYEKILGKYPFVYLEDPFSQDDLSSWNLLSTRYPLPTTNCLIVSDDLTATNPERIKMAQEKNLCNGVIIKPNQIGAITQTIEAATLAKSFGWKIIASHRSGDTGDTFIADLAFGLGCDFVKFGAPARGERTEKYNRLLEIENNL